jgi:hypothetical protein
LVLKSRYVFLDTSVLIGLNFNYSCETLKSLVELTEADRAHLVLTSVMVREVEANINEEVHSSVQALTRFRGAARILRNLSNPPYDNLFSSFDDAAAEGALVEQFREFLAATKAEVIAPPAQALETALAWYFDMKPPFGEGKKKYEFPDAFTLLALESWCVEKSRKLYVISSDKDIENYCKTSQNLFYYARLGEFLDQLIRDDEELAPLVDKLVEAHRDDVEASIGEAFLNLNFYFRDLDGDVTDVTLQKVVLQDHSLIQVTEDTAIVEVTANIAFIAHIDFAEYDRKVWPINVNQSEEVTAIMFLSFDAQEPEASVIKQIKINIQRSRGIGINLPLINDAYQLFYGDDR